MLLFEKSSKIKIIIITETSVEKVAMMIRKKQKQVLFASIDALTSLILVKSKMRFVMNRLYTLSCLFLNTQNPLECVYDDISCLNLISINRISLNNLTWNCIFKSIYIPAHISYWLVYEKNSFNGCRCQFHMCKWADDDISNTTWFMFAWYELIKNIWQIQLNWQG